MSWKSWLTEVVKGRRDVGSSNRTATRGHSTAADVMHRIGSLEQRFATDKHRLDQLAQLRLRIVEEVGAHGEPPPVEVIDRLLSMIERGNLPGAEALADGVRMAATGGTSKGTIDDRRTAHHLNGFILSILHDEGPLSAPAFARALGLDPSALPVLYKLEMHLGYLHLASLAVHEQLSPVPADRVMALAREDLVGRFEAEDRDAITDLVVDRLSAYAQTQGKSSVTPTSAFAERLYRHITGRPHASMEALRPISLLYPVLLPAFRKFVESIKR